MSEYEEKIEELKALGQWFADHKEDVREREDGIVIYVIHDQRVTASGAAGEDHMAAIVLDILTHIEQQQKEIHKCSVPM